MRLLNIPGVGLVLRLLIAVVAALVLLWGGRYLLDLRADLLVIPTTVDEVQSLIPERYSITVTGVTLIKRESGVREYLLDTTTQPVFVRFVEEEENVWLLDQLDRLRE